MSSKRLGWTAFSCAALAALIAGLGIVLQIALILYGLYMTLVAVSMPAMALGVDTGPVVISVPRVLPVALSISGLLAAITLACVAGLVRNRRRRIG